VLIRWLKDESRFPAHLVFAHQLSMVPEGYPMEKIASYIIGYYVGRVLVSEANFVVHHFHGKAMLLKNLCGAVGPLEGLATLSQN
jgi:hypothetical protein